MADGQCNTEFMNITQLNDCKLDAHTSNAI